MQVENRAIRNWMSTAFLFGAGASAFSGDCTPEPPPDGKRLFERMQASGTPVARSITGSLAERFTEDFEEGMAEFERTRGRETSALLREMAAFFLPLAPGQENLYVKLVRAVLETRTQAVFSTLNYDLLLDQSVNLAGQQVIYDGRLPVPAGNLLVLKLHGSCNFVPYLGGNVIRGIESDFRGVEAIVDGPVQVSTVADALRFCAEQDSLAPAIALYNREKKVWFCPTATKRIAENWRAELKRARRIFVIGVKVNPRDAHIWEPLRSASASLGYVGPDGEEFLDWCRSEKRRGGYHLAPSFADAVPLIRSQLTRTI